MGEEKPSLMIDNFPGMIDAADPNDIPEGAAQVQINLSSAKAGLMRTRLGFMPVTFEASSMEAV